MAEIDAATEQRIADRRARLRQNQSVPFLIRDDGMLYPNTVLVARKPNFRPYHGDPKATLTDRLRYLQGLGAKRAVSYTPEPEAPFDIGAADVDALAEFAQEQYGAILDTSKPIKTLREQVYKLSQLPDPALALPDPQAADVGTTSDSPSPRATKVSPPKPKAAGGLNVGA